MRSRIIAIGLLCVHLPLAAQEQPATDGATERENPVTRVPCESGKPPPAPCEDRWSDFLPIWGKDACERGFVLPRPFKMDAIEAWYRALV